MINLTLKLADCQQECVRLQEELVALKDAAITLYYGGLLSPEMCAKIEDFAARVGEE